MTPHEDGLDNIRSIQTRVLWFTMGIIMGISLTLIIGYSIVVSFDGLFSNMNTTISFNETRLVEEMNKTIVQRAVP